MSIPEIEMVLTKINPKSRPCYVCGKDMNFSLMVIRVEPAWVGSSRFLYEVWKLWLRYVQRLPLWVQCHNECLTPEFKTIKVVQEQDLVAYHSLEVEKDLIAIMEEEIRDTR